MKPLAEFGAAISLLTRLPGGLLVRGGWPAPERCVWAYPLVGLLVGAVGGSVLVAAERVGVPPLAAAILAVGSTSWLTGGLHEDGLADTFDAIGGGRTVEGRLAIMRDSRIGAHGALALGLSLLLRAACLEPLSAGRGALAFATAAMLGRASMLIVIGLLRPTRPDGLAAPLARASRGRIAFGLAFTLALTFVLAPRPAFVSAAAAMVGLGVTAVARRCFGGFTGDVLGASAVLAECGALLASVARVG